MTDNIAPEGKQWLCMMCGKRAKDLYGDPRTSWDESCSMNAVLVDYGAMPTDAACEAFNRRHSESLERSRAEVEKLLEDMKNGVLPEFDAELDAAAKAAIERMDARKADAGKTGGA